MESQYICPRGPRGPNRTTHFLFNYRLATTCLLSSIQQETLTALQRELQLRRLFVPGINFQTVAPNLNSVEHVTPRTNRITPQIPCSFSLSALSLELPWSGSLRVGAGERGPGVHSSVPFRFDKKQTNKTNKN